MKVGLIDKSLLISVADYMPDENGNQIDLNGPNNDTKDVSMVLTMSQKDRPKRRFRAFLRRIFKARKSTDSRSHVRITDRECTAKNIKKELANFASSVQDEELGLFHYSGHGTQALDTTGLEPDGLAECLCPYDTMIGQLVFDDEIKEILRTNLTSTGKIIMVLDCCHSGGQARSMDKARGVELNLKVSRNYTYSDQLHENVLLWTACGEGEVAWERMYNGSPRGAFTQAVLPYIKQLAEGVKVDFKKAHVEVLKALNPYGVPNNEGSQTPHMESRNDISEFWQ